MFRDIISFGFLCHANRAFRICGSNTQEVIGGARDIPWLKNYVIFQEKQKEFRLFSLLTVL